MWLVGMFVLGAWGCGPEIDPNRGFRVVEPLVVYYGNSEELSDLQRFADSYRVIIIEADPGFGYWTPEQVEFLKQGGRNHVLSYLNFGSCETYRTYWDQVPEGFVSCKDNVRAQRGAYEGYPDEVWMDPSDPDYQRLLLEHMAPRMAEMGVDGFLLDNVEILEHGSDTANGPCDAECFQGGLELLLQLRERFPTLRLVLNHGTGDAIRTATVGGRALTSLVDGVHQEGVYVPRHDLEVERQLLAWRDLNLQPGGNAFFIGTTDYVGSCDNTEQARGAFEQSRSHGFSPYASDAANGLNVVCYWPF